MFVALHDDGNIVRVSVGVSMSDSGHVRSSNWRVWDWIASKQSPLAAVPACSGTAMIVSIVM
jgi:hypothetical protein